MIFIYHDENSIEQFYNFNEDTDYVIQTLLYGM